MTPRATVLRGGLAGLLLLFCSVMGALPAAGSEAPVQDGDGLVNIDHLQVGDDGEISLVLAVDQLAELPAAADIAVTIAGQDADSVEVARLDEDTTIARTVVLALDASLSMRREGRWAAAQDAAQAFLAAAPEDVRVGLVTFSGGMQDVVEPTTDHDAVAAAIDAVELTLGTDLYDAVIESVALAGDDGARSVLLLSDGEDAGKASPLPDAVAAATDASVVVDAVALQQPPAARAAITEIADSSGGGVIDADSPAALEAAFRAQADSLDQQLLITFPQPADPPSEASIEVRVAAGDREHTDAVFTTLTAVEDEITVVAPNEPLIGTTGLVLGAGALAVGLAGVLSVVLIGEGHRSRAERQLATYFGAAEAKQRVAGTQRRLRADGEAATPSLRDSAVALTTKVVKGDFEARITQKLAGGGSKLTAAEWLLIHSGITIAAAFIGLVFAGPALMVVGLLVGAVLPWLYLSRRHSKRLSAFNGQLAETLNMVGGGLQAGLSLPQAVDTVIQEGQEPMAGELRRALVEQRLGVPMEQALDGVADRMSSEDFSWVVMAIRIQREVGGNLAELLGTVANTLREREYLRRQVKVLSAEGRFSAWVLGGLPVAFFGYMVAFRPEYSSLLYSTPIGMLLLGAAVGLLIAGGFVLSRIVKVEV